MASEVISASTAGCLARAPALSAAALAYAREAAAPNTCRAYRAAWLAAECFSKVRST